MESPLYIVWWDKNNLGIPIIDEQHRGIVATINSLHYFIRTGHGFEVLKPILSMLRQYTYLHFRTEERLMKQAGYPGFQDHVKLHRELIREARATAREAIDHHDPDIVLKFLKFWWLNHINREDKKYAPYVKKELEIT